MTQQIQIGARLSPATTGTAIGYRIDTLAGVEHVAFTTSGVVELDVAGAWHVADPVSVPDAGAIVYWGTSGDDLLAESYGPAADAATLAVLTTIDTVVDAILVDTGTDGVVIADGAITAAKIASDAITDAKVASDVTIAAVTGAVGSVTGNVGGSVASVVAGVTLATDAVSAAALAADAVTEIQSGLATAANLAVVDGVVDAILVDTGTDGVVIVDGAITAAKIASDAITAAKVASDAIVEIQSGLATPTNITAGTITTVTNLTNAPTNGDLTSTMKASVNAEIVDALATDTYAELGGVPAATSSLKDKINWLFALARNKIAQTATTQTLRNDADDTDVATAAVSDSAGTFTRDGWS